MLRQQIFVLLILNNYRNIFGQDETVVPNIQDNIQTRYAVCSRLPDRGETCGPRVIRWYFDFVRQTCRAFEYNGCKGNPNNFPTRDFCNSYCNRACPYDARPLTREDGGIKICDSQQSCPNDYSCTEVTVENLKTHYCCPTKYAICNQPPQIGEICTEASARWYFNPQSKLCSRFMYNGCNGNSNNFKSSKECTDFCQSTACLPGESVIRTRNAVQTCDVGNGNNSCSDGYSCRDDALYGRNVCCGLKPGVCPDGSKPYVESGSASESRICEMGRSDACPSPYVCSPNLEDRINYCCVPMNEDDFCYKGQKVYKSDVTSLPKVCRIRSTSDCPTDFQCTSIYAFAVDGYCCSGTPSDSVIMYDLPLDDIYNETFGFRNDTNFFNLSDFDPQRVMNDMSIKTFAEFVINDTVVPVNVTNLIQNELIANATDRILKDDSNGNMIASDNQTSEKDWSNNMTAFINKSSDNITTIFDSTNSTLYKRMRDDVTADNDTASMKNATRMFFDAISNATDFTNATNIGRPAMSPERLNAPSEAGPQVVNNTVNTEPVGNSPSSGQSDNSGQDAMVNLVTDCQDDQSCPIGYICQRNAFSTQSNCLLFEYAMKMRQTVGPARSPPQSVSEMRPSNLSETSANISVSVNASNNQSNNSAASLRDQPMGFGKICDTDVDCSAKYSCAQTQSFGKVCVQDEMLKNITQCPNSRFSELARSANVQPLSFCAGREDCLSPCDCIPVEQYRICCCPK